MLVALRTVEAPLPREEALWWIVFVTLLRCLVFGAILVPYDIVIRRYVWRSEHDLVSEVNLVLRVMGFAFVAGMPALIELSAARRIDPSHFRDVVAATLAAATYPVGYYAIDLQFAFLDAFPAFHSWELAEQRVTRLAHLHWTWGWAGILWSCSRIVLFGALTMMRLRRWPFAVTLVVAACATAAAEAFTWRLQLVGMSGSTLSALWVFGWALIEAGYALVLVAACSCTDLIERRVSRGPSSGRSPGRASS